MRRILIVDDEPAVREAVAMVLTDEGYTVLMAPDGRMALEMIAPALDHTVFLSKPFDLEVLLAAVRQLIGHREA